MGNWLFGNDREMREKAEREVRRLEEQSKKDNEKKAMTEKISRQRTKVLKKMPGDSKQFQTDGKIPSRLFISLFGETGTGKTSLINSLKYTIDGELKPHKKLNAAPRNFQGGGHTIDSVEACLTTHLSVIDNRGINSEKVANATSQEDVIRQMEGKYKQGTVFWTTPTEEHEDHKSYCSVLVFSAHHSNVVRQYRDFIKRLRDWQGCYPLAVITHVDEVSSANVRLALGTAGIGNIYEVANIDSGKPIIRDNVSPKYQLQLIELLKKSFIDGDFIFMRRQRLKSVE